MHLEGQTQLSFESQRQEQEGQEPATAIEKDDETTTAQAKSKERKLWLKKHSWLGYEKNGNYMYCRVCTETRKSNATSKEAQCRNFQNTMLTGHVGLLERKVAFQGLIRGSPKKRRNKAE